MGMYLSLGKKKSKDLDFNRFKSAFSIFSEIIELKKEKQEILFYRDFPLQEINESFDRINFDFGILESSFRKKIKEMENKGESLRAGFELEADVILENDRFNLLFELLPRNRSKYYDIVIDILPSPKAENFESLEKIKEDLRVKIFERIVSYNKSAHKQENLFYIKRAVMSDYKKQFNEISSWSFFYSKDPEDFINYLSYGDRELKERLSFANRKKFAHLINELDSYIIKLFEYAKESQVQIKEGSLALIPENKKSMEVFVKRMREKISLVAKKTYPTKKDLDEELQKVFSE